MAKEPFVRDKIGNRVFVIETGKPCPIEGGGMVCYAAKYVSDEGRTSKHPTVIMTPGDKVFIPGGKTSIRSPAYASAMNRKVSDPKFNYVAYAAKHEGTAGLMIRCVERKKKTT